MHIVAFFLALAGAAAVAILYPRLRIPAALVVAFFLGLIAYVLIDRPTEPERRAARISVEELSFSDVRLVEEARFSRLQGRVQNLSAEYRLRDFGVTVSLYDCPSEDTPRQDCTVIAQDSGIVRVDLPPRQARAFDTVLRFRDTPPLKGFPAWDYAVTTIAATD